MKLDATSLDKNGLRLDYAIISEWVAQGEKVLDLGCGDGTLLNHLQTTRGVRGYGLEINPQEVIRCIERGVNVIQADLDAGLAQFETGAFDCVIMAEALQVVLRPDGLLEEMLRVSQRSIVTFPNFGHWRCRFGLTLGGRMPVSPSLPNQWYNTPNIHLCTVSDFEQLCRSRGIRISRRAVVNRHHRVTLGARLWPNMLGEIALYELCRA